MKNKLSFPMTLLICLFVFTGPMGMHGQTSLPTFFSDNMVLQQNERVAFWGTDTPGTEVKVITGWGEKENTKAGKDGKWKLKIATPKAGGPYEITIEGTQEVFLKEVLIGEVWLASGQSNMYMPMKGFTNQPILESNEAILHSENNQIRLFTVERNASLTFLDDVHGEWLPSNPATVADFSATAYYFGKLLNEILDVPIGIISTSWGGSTVEAWMDGETLSDLNEVNINLPDELPTAKRNKTPTLLYNAMIKPFVGFRIKGILWYQGEANVSRPQDYKVLFPSLINSWRDQWQHGEFPFYFAQIAPYNYQGNNSAFLRESQFHSFKQVANSGMAVTLDIGNCENIHPANKKTVGERLAYWALAKDYGIGSITYSGPLYKAMEITEEGINISFDHASNGLTSFRNKLSEFEISGEDQIFYPAKAKINRDKTVTVWSEKVDKPVAVRYAFDNCTEGTLFNVGGLPASSFRTDNWMK